MEEVWLEDEAATQHLGASVLARLAPGDVVFLTGRLGAGKTTFAQGLIAAAGWQESVRSPTFQLVQIYPTSPPILHTDLYRVQSAEGLGIEDALESHVVLVEWPDRAGDFFAGLPIWRVELEDSGDRRLAIITPPAVGKPSEPH